MALRGHLRVGRLGRTDRLQCRAVARAPRHRRGPRYGPEREHIEVYAAVADLIAARDLSAPRCLIEIGCGRGGGLAYLQRRFAGTVVGIDVIGAAVRYARARGLDARRASATALPFPDASFDVAVAVEILFRFGDADDCMAELRRVLKPGGMLAVADFRPYPFVDARNYLTALATRSGFAIEHLDDRSADARRAVEAAEPRRRAVAAAMPMPIRWLMADTLALADTPRYRGWMAGDRSYVVSLLVRRSEAAAADGPGPGPAAGRRSRKSVAGDEPGRGEGASRRDGNARRLRWFGPGRTP